MAYVYRHIRTDLNQPFYIGIGTRNDNYFRAYQKTKNKRSNFWFNIAKNGYEVEILFDNISKGEAILKEKEFIKLYGRKDINTGILCNLTDGGEMPPKLIGDKNPMKRLDVRQKISNSRKGIRFTEDHKLKLSISKKEKGIIPPSRKGVVLSKELVYKSVNTRLKYGIGRKKIYQYDKNLNLLNVWNYGKEIKDIYKNYSIGNIHMCCRNERKFAYNCIWSFKEITK